MRGQPSGLAINSQPGDIGSHPVFTEVIYFTKVALNIWMRSPLYALISHFFAKEPCLLSTSIHEYNDVCCERDGPDFAKRRRVNAGSIGEEERQRKRGRPAATLRADGRCGRSLRCSSSPMRTGIDSSSLLDLASQAPSAKVIVITGRNTSDFLLPRTSLPIYFWQATSILSGSHESSS